MRFCHCGSRRTENRGSRTLRFFAMPSTEPLPVRLQLSESLFRAPKRPRYPRAYAGKREGGAYQPPLTTSSSSYYLSLGSGTGVQVSLKIPRVLPPGKNLPSLSQSETTGIRSDKTIRDLRIQMIQFRRTVIGMIAPHSPNGSSCRSQPISHPKLILELGTRHCFSCVESHRPPPRQIIYVCHCGRNASS